MMKICKACCGCGFYVGYGGYRLGVDGVTVAVACKVCHGKGWVKDDAD